MSTVSFIEILKIIVLASVLFVWIVRYDNIVVEFKEYGLPDWLRDFVGILKISFVIMLQSSNDFIILVGAIGITFLMLAAIFTHLRIKNPFRKIVPSASLMILSLIIFFHNF